MKRPDTVGSARAGRTTEICGMAVNAGTWPPLFSARSQELLCAKLLNSVSVLLGVAGIAGIDKVADRLAKKGERITPTRLQTK